MSASESASPYAADSPYAWRRLAISLVFATLACIGSWSVVVALPAVQAEFGVVRGAASAPYTLMMIGFAAAAIGMGRLSDRYGVVPAMVIAALCQSGGYVLAGLSGSIWQFGAAHLLIGIGASIGFAPLIADVSHWFVRSRGLAVGITATGNYLAGALWSPILQHMIATQGWRWSHVAIGLILLVFMLPMALLFRRRAPQTGYASAEAASEAARSGLGLSPNALMAILCVAGFGCCMAMAMPQVHIVAYCADLGYGAARGAEMLALMLGLGIVSRIGSGFLADRIGGVAVLLIGSSMQAAALFLYLWFDGLASLYVISGIFGLFQGGIVPMYAMIARQYMPPREAGARVGFVITATILGMAAGGLASGYIFDLFGSYRMAFLNGLAWNLLNIMLIGWLYAWPRLKQGQPA
ncbi:MAG: MFS transporter [Beijerinckiaceae bacterium]|jgi:MFS family permease|nr:MFS transporter [Beijerinckiaceae bacterium]